MRSSWVTPRPISIAGYSFLALAVTTGFLVTAYTTEVKEGCKKSREFTVVCAREDALCSNCKALLDADGQPDIWNRLFFSLQTVTTTGYGSGIFLEFHSIQRLAVYGMASGTFFWSLFMAAFFAWITESRDKRSEGQAVETPKGSASP